VGCLHIVGKVQSVTGHEGPEMESKGTTLLLLIAMRRYERIGGPQGQYGELGNTALSSPLQVNTQNTLT
jgi:hypothetical protein